MNKYLAVYNGKNRRFRSDGSEFQREAHAWYDAQTNATVKAVDVRDGRIRREIEYMPGLSVLAIFDHGTPKGLPRMRESYKCVKGLAETIASVTKKITIILYACSCGRGWWWWKPKNKRNFNVLADLYSPRDGYAVALECELTKLNVDAEVWAHTTAGHTTRNPNVVRVVQADPGVIWRRQQMLSSSWRQWRRDMQGPERFTFWW